MLNKDNKKPGYLLGRFIAVMTSALSDLDENKVVCKVADSDPHFEASKLLRRAPEISNAATQALIREILSEFDFDAIPQKVMDPPTMGDFFLGFYHQKSALLN